MGKRREKGPSAFWSAAIYRRFPWNGPNCHPNARQISQQVADNLSG